MTLTGTHDSATDGDNDGNTDGTTFVLLSVERDQDLGETCTVDASGPWCRSDLECGICDTEDAGSTCQILMGGERSSTSSHL